MMSDRSLVDSRMIEEQPEGSRRRFQREDAHLRKALESSCQHCRFHENGNIKVLETGSVSRCNAIWLANKARVEHFGDHRANRSRAECLAVASLTDLIKMQHVVHIACLPVSGCNMKSNT